MGPFMLAKMVLATETFLAPPTGIGSNATVDATVTSELFISGEGFLAVFVVAYEGALA